MLHPKRFLSILILAASMIALLQGCFAAGPMVQSSRLLGLGDTLMGLKTVITEQPGTFLMTDGKLILAAWPRGINYAFCVMTRGGDPVDIQGLGINTLNLTTMINGLKSEGWRFMVPAELPPALFSALSSYTIQMIALSSRAMPSFYLVPVSIIQPANVNEVQQ